MKGKTLLGYIFLIFFILPLGTLVFYFHPGNFPSSTFRILAFSLSLASVGSILALIIGLPVAFVAAQNGLFPKILAATVLVPLFLPVNIVSILIFQVYENLAQFLHIDGRGNFWGLVFAHAFYETPIVVFYFSLALRTLPNAYFNLMYCDGFSLGRQYLLSLRMIQSQARQAIAMIFLYIFQSTSLVIVLGLGRFQTLESAILISTSYRSNLAIAISLAMVQAVVLGLLFFLAINKNGFRYVLTEEKQVRTLPRSPLCYIWSGAFLLVIVYTLSPLFLSGWQGLLENLEIWKKFPLWQSLVNSMLISILASGIALCFVILWIFYNGGRQITYPLVISQSIYFSGILLCGILWSFSPWMQAIWGLAISLIPLMYFFLKSGEVSEDGSILHAARLDGASGFFLWRTIYFPLWRERWFAVFWKGVLLAFGNFPFAYILSQKKLPMASAVLSQLMNRRYISEANGFSTIIFILMLIPMLFFLQKKKRV